MQWGFLKRPNHSKIDVFVKFESAINLEIRGQIFRLPRMAALKMCIHF